MEPIFELAVHLPPRGSRNLRRELNRQMKAAIIDGRLRPETRLPPTRALAAALNVSRNTAVAAYEQLLSEGYLVARPGAGTFVADVAARAPKTRVSAPGTDARLTAFWRAASAASPTSAGAVPYDFSVGLPDKMNFPYRVWRRLSARALRDIARTPVAYASAAGQPALREAIARHVSLMRAVACDGDDLVVTVGAQQAFDLLARILVTPGRTVVAVEDPGYPPARAAFAAAGATIAAVPIDDEGLVVDKVPPATRVIVVTPSHQFPLGTVMSAARRQALLQFAQAKGAVVIEDDYDGEFRFGGRPLDALQTLDGGENVFYVGTFSKSLFPALRLGFVVAPPWARPALIAARQVADGHGPVLVQDTLTAFIAEGHLMRHVRRMRKVYGERRAALLAALAKHCGDRLVPIAGEAGLHLAGRLRGPVRADAVAARAAKQGLRLQPLSAYAAGRVPVNGFAFGYGVIAAGEIDAAVRRLARVLAL